MKRSTSKQPDEVEFFLDRDLGPTPGCEFIRILRDAGMAVHAHHEHFAHAPDDDEWLVLCGERGWIGVSRDKDILNLKDIAVTTIMQHGVKAFVCIGQYRHPRIARNIVNSRHRMARWVRKYREPFIARLYMASEDEIRRGKSGEVKMWLTYTKWLEKTGRA